ncbi:MAG: response regulator [Desulfobacterales bacterium]|nr:response regulator [Desulfobacterales bacterium]
MPQNILKDKKILVVDDEWDVIDTLVEILYMARVDVAQDHETALEKIDSQSYDLAILDIMGVNGMVLLEHCVRKNIPSVMLTANAMNPAALMESIEKGAISYLPKEHMAELDELLGELLGAQNDGKPTWKILFDKLGAHFDLRFGKEWKAENRDFWDEFEQGWKISRGIQERLRHVPELRDKGI